MFVGSKLLALFALVSAAYALPSTIPVLDSIPSNAVKVAHDTDLDIVVAYDAEGHILGHLPASVGLRAIKRDAGTCVTMSADDVQKLSGWEKLAQYAKDNWGDGYGVHANPEDYPDRGAVLCIAGDITPVTLDGEPQCRTQSQTTGGTIVGANGTVLLSANQGTTQTTTVTVTQESSLAIGVTMSAKVTIPAVAEFSASVTSTVTFTNSLSTATTFTSTNAQTQTVTLQNEAGKTCSLTFDVQTCDVPGSGSMRLLASGWAWVFYGERREGHYKWAMNMDALLSEQDRETFIGFKTSTSSSTSAKYNAVCE